MSWWLLCGLAFGQELSGSVHGDVKAFFVASFPYEHPVLAPDASPTATAAIDGRLKLEAKLGPFQGVVHHAITGTAPNAAQGGGAIGTGVGRRAPEALPLTWVGADGEGLRLQGRTDRLYLKLSVPGLDVTLGRQAISFGHGSFFTPLDLVSPFFPTTIDQEYKPGVDALRVDGYFGMSLATAVVAYTGDATLSDATALNAEQPYDAAADTTAALYVQTTVGVSDLGAFYGYVHEDHVVGATLVTSVGPVGVQADATVTVPPEGQPFFRGTLGALYRPTATTTLTGEFYVQSLGAGDPTDYFALQTEDRWRRGELWLSGRYYLGLAVSQEITPILHGNLAVIANLADPSMFVAPTLSWSVAGNAEVGFGAYFGVGKRPGEVDAAALLEASLGGATEAEVARLLGVRSEFGSYPHAGFVQVKAYF